VRRLSNNRTSDSNLWSQYNTYIIRAQYCMASQVIPEYLHLADIAVTSTNVLLTHRIQHGCATSGIDSPRFDKVTESSYGSRIWPAHSFSLFNLFWLLVRWLLTSELILLSTFVFMYICDLIVLNKTEYFSPFSSRLRILLSTLYHFANYLFVHFVRRQFII
jgi:hypothetical protein